MKRSKSLCQSGNRDTQSRFTTKTNRPVIHERARQLSDIAETGDEDNAEVASAELLRDYPDFSR